MPGHLVPRETDDQPAGRRDHVRLANRVIPRLPGVLLAIELEEDAELGPAQVDEGDELAGRVGDLALADRLPQSRYLPAELDGHRLQQAAGRGAPGWPLRQDPANADRARRRGATRR